MTVLDRVGAVEVIATLVTFAAVAASVVSESRTGVRRALLLVASAAFTVWMLYGDGWRPDEGVYVRAALWTAGEAGILFLFVETTAWRWSLAPGLAAVGSIVMHVMLNVYGSWTVSKRISWLVFALGMLIANGALRAMREEDRVQATGDDEGSTGDGGPDAGTGTRA